MNLAHEVFSIQAMYRVNKLSSIQVLINLYDNNLLKNLSSLKMARNVLKCHYYDLKMKEYERLKNEHR